jgi:hypothetical protein
MEEGRDAGGVAPGPSLDTFRGYSRVERALLPFLREPTLWPVLLAVIAHAVALTAPLMVVVWRDPTPGWPMIGLIVLAALSLAGVRVELRDRGRPGAICGLLASTWVLCCVGAWAGVHLGIL